MKKVASAILALWMTCFFLAQPVWADPTVEIVTNGGITAYSPGYVMVISGKVADEDLPMPNTDVFIQVYPDGKENNVIFYSGTKTDSKGYYKAIFTLPSGSSLPDGQYKIAVNTAQASAEQLFSVPVAAQGLEFMGSTIKGAENGFVEPVPVDTDQIALVFNSNVNFFYNKNYPDFVIGKNDNNEDSIKLFKGNTPEAARVELIDSMANSGAVDLSYYQKGSQTVLQETDSKKIVLLSPESGLEPNTDYRIFISKDLCSNNGSKLGQDVTLSFKTGERTAVNPGPGGPSGDNPGPADPSDDQPGTPEQNVPAVPEKIVPAPDLGNIVNDNNTVTLDVDVNKATDVLKNIGEASLVIDVSQEAGKDKTVSLPADVVDLLKQMNKLTIIRDGELSLSIPPEALIQGKKMTFSSSQVSGEALTTAPAAARQKAVYSFSASSDGVPLHNFNKEIRVTLPIPAGTADQDKLGVYYLNEASGQWEYVGGRIKEGKLTFGTSHFSTFMVAESEKTFADIQSHWAKKEIEVMVARHVIKGINETSFAPKNNITRAEFASLLSRVLNLADAASGNVFQDVSTGAWYASDVNKAVKAGIIKGSDRRFRPSDKISRQEMAVMIERAYTYAGGKVSTLSNTAFTDNERIGAWASNAVKSVYTLGIIKGRPNGSFGPADNASRAEGAVMLKSLMDKLGL
ncbi:S-layer homology domain-containing protein [Paenibacillus sophorae]|uniref:S-layer homology domain-containing protein n=1 Tax=Paenibacillus sophorae TaxID=1333845 RepID=A0A1H8S0Y7_9BACL|nr:S-layer homology domain-containing protein [Paenibacillus sophorae]QWU16885.1 S-layer homology domain-containing protein [Paenibacillus sophorae]SEO72330.1 S-layer homology domain-containing protein [Paenibacillus sophorae]